LFDPAVLDWSPLLLEAFGIPPDVLPRCVGTTHAFGSMDVGNGRSVPLHAMSGDQSAAIFGFGPPEPATAYVNAGTGAFVQRLVLDGSSPTPAGLLRSVLYARTDETHGALYSHEGTVNGGYAALEWLAGRVGIDVKHTLATLATVLAGRDVPVLFMNGVGGLAAPYWITDFPIEFVATAASAASTAAAASATELQQLAAIVESIAFLVAVNVRSMQRAAPLQRILITGGLASCDYLCEVIAAVTGLRVDRPEALEATARGIAFLAAGQPDGWQAVPTARAFAPDAGHSAVQRFGPWREAMAARGA
jgi:glycerol kinase